MEKPIEVKLYAKHFMNAKFFDVTDCPLARAFKEQHQDLIQGGYITVGAWDIKVYEDEISAREGGKKIKILLIEDDYGFGKFLEDEERVLTNHPDFDTEEPIRIITLTTKKENGEEE